MYPALAEVHKIVTISGIKLDAPKIVIGQIIIGPMLLHGSHVASGNPPVPTTQHIGPGPIQKSSGEADIELGAHDGGRASEEPARQTSPDAAPAVGTPRIEKEKAVLQALNQIGVEIDDPTWLQLISQSISHRDLQALENLCVPTNRAINVLLQLHHNRSYKPLRKLRDYLTLQACDRLATHASLHDRKAMSDDDREAMYVRAFVLYETRMRLTDEEASEGDRIVVKKLIEKAKRPKNTLPTSQQVSQGGAEKRTPQRWSRLMRIPLLPCPLPCPCSCPRYPD